MTGFQTSMYQSTQINLGTERSKTTANAETTGPAVGDDDSGSKGKFDCQIKLLEEVCKK